MRINRNRRPLAVAVPVHNEEVRLPRLIESLRAQTAVGVAVVFVDNGSTDSSGALVRACPETAGGRWHYLEEKRVGKATAMATATVYCADELGAQNVCFLDADSYCLDERWIETSEGAAREAGESLAYIYSPVTYTGLEGAPVFATAYRACEAVLHRAICTGASFGYASAATYPADLLRRFLCSAERDTEQGLRLSLLALWEGRSPRLNTGVVASSARRIVVNPRNLRRWSFYDRDFYRHKDINGDAKLDLDARTDAADLDPSEVGLFFARQALKIATRNLACPALFDATGALGARIFAAFGVDLGSLVRALRPSLDGECVFGARLDDLMQQIARFPETIALAGRLENLMRREHRSLLPASPLEPRRRPGAAEDPTRRSPAPR